MNQTELRSAEMKEAGLYLVELIRSALTEVQAKEKPEAVSWELVYKMAKRNHVEAVSAYGLSGLLDLPSEELLKKWNEAKTNTLFKVLHFDAEREQILAEMEAKGLSYLPLKGILLAGYYPNPGMRSMADNDILYGFVEKSKHGEYQICGDTEKAQEETIKKAQKLMVEIMKKRGFEVGHLVGNHDSFYKKPFYNFEMHRELLLTSDDEKQYYKNSWLKAIPDEGSKFGFHMSDEDEYIFLIVHMEKHFSHGGCGVRHLNDIYIFWKQKGNALDKAYLKEEFSKLGLVDFEKKIRTLMEAVYLEKRSLREEEENMLFYLLDCGTYGKMDVRVTNKIKKIQDEAQAPDRYVRLRYLKERFFLDKQLIKEYYPFFYQHKCLRPILLLYRMVRGFVIHPKVLLAEWKMIWKKFED